MSAGALARGREVARLLAGCWRGDALPADLSPDLLADLVPRLLASGAGGAAWWRLRETALAASREAHPLQQAYRLTAARHALLAQHVRDAFAAMRARGVEPLLGKGWAIAREYPSPGIRPYGDVDLYVRAEQHAAAATAIGESGAPLDLHRGFAELDDRDPEVLLARSRVVDVEGIAVRVLSPEDHFRLLALHMLRHGALRPLWLCDVALATESRPADFDWACFASGSRRRTAWVGHALRLAHEVLGARLDGVPAALVARALPAWAVDAVHAAWGEPVTAQGARSPMAAELARPGRLWAALRERWPNGIEATVGVGGGFSRAPRLPYQLGASVVRGGRFAASLVARRRPH